MKPASYVWGLGLSRTGTTSLEKALKILGYNPIHYPYRFEDIEGYDSGSDIPILLWFEELDQKYPNSKFIWTERDISSWLVSCKKYFALHSNPPQRVLELRQDCYSCLDFDQARFREAYYQWGAKVLNYFKDRPEDLLVLRVTDGEGWEKICPFLGQSIPDQLFPIANQAVQKTPMSKLGHAAKNILNFG